MMLPGEAVSQHSRRLDMGRYRVRKLYLTQSPRLDTLECVEHFRPQHVPTNNC